MFIIVLFIITKNWNNPNVVNALVYVQNVILFSNLKKLLINAAQIHLKVKVVSDRSQKQKAISFMSPFVQHSRKGKTIVTNGRSLMASADGGRRKLTSKKQKITFWGDGHFLYAVQYGSPSHIWPLRTLHVARMTEGLDF